MHVPKPYEVSVVGILFIVCCTLFLLMRLYARKMSAMALGIDDWVTVASWVVVMGLCSLLTYDSFRGHLDESIFHMSPKGRTMYLERLFAEGLLSYVSLALTKIAVVLFYLRIFTVTNFRKTAYWTLGAIVVWFLGSFLTAVFSDGPDPSVLWLGSKKKLTNYYPATQVAFNVVDLVLDLWILCLPVPMIRGLQISRPRKVGLLGMFWLGTFCVVAGAMRLYYSVVRFNAPNIAVMTPEESIYILVNTAIWGAIEPACSLIAACLPTLGPLIKEDWNIYKPFRGVVDWLGRTLTSMTSLLTSRGSRSRTEASTTSSLAHDEQHGWYSLDGRATTSVKGQKEMVREVA